MGYTYKGFKSPQTGKTKILYDEELIKADLLNHFNTQKGERIGNYEYGSIIWDLLFDLDREQNISDIKEDVKRIIASDKRVSLLGTSVQRLPYGYVVNVELRFNDLRTTGDLKIYYDKRLTNRLK